MIYTYSTIKEKAISTSDKKCIEIETNNRQVLETFLTELRNCNIMDKLNVDAKADPNINFDCFMKYFIFIKLKQQCLHKKKDSV